MLCPEKFDLINVLLSGKVVCRTHHLVHLWFHTRVPARLITALIRLRESWSATRQKLLEFDRHSETKCKVGEFVRSIFKTYVSAVKMHCPTQISNATTITLSHGEGGTLMRQLIRERIISKFESCNFPSLSDAAWASWDA